MNYKSFVFALALLLASTSCVYAQNKGKQVGKAVEAAVSKKVPAGAAAKAAKMPKVTPAPAVKAPAAPRVPAAKAATVAPRANAAAKLPPPVSVAKLAEGMKPASVAVASTPQLSDLLSTSNISVEQFPDLEMQLSRFVVRHNYKFAPDQVIRSVGRVFGRADSLFENGRCSDYKQCWEWETENDLILRDSPKAVRDLLSTESPLKTFFEWRNLQKQYAEGRIFVAPKRPTLVGPKGNPVKLYSNEEQDILSEVLSADEIEMVTKKAGTPYTYRNNLKKVFKETDKLFFDKYNTALYYANPMIAGEYDSYKELWMVVAKKYSPSSVLKFLPEESPLNKIFELRDQQIRESLEGIPPTQKALSSRYVMVSENTSQRTAEEIRALVENLDSSDPLRQSIERTLEDNGYRVP